MMMKGAIYFLILSNILVNICTLPTSTSTNNISNERSPKLSLIADEWYENNNYYNMNNNGPGTYEFGYDIEDQEENNVQFRNEERLSNGTIIGSYGYLRPDGLIQMVNYVADHLGYRATMETLTPNTLKRRVLDYTRNF